MKAVNLYVLTRNTEEDFISEYENVLSGREKATHIKEHEFRSLIRLVQILQEKKVTVGELDGFYYSYTIGQIGKEFDLLKLCRNDKVLNIELKSEAVSEQKIEKQLLKNKYYLSHIAQKIYAFTYVEEADKLYWLNGEKAETCEWDKLVQALKGFNHYETGDIGKLFRPRDFLISPLNTPEKFVEGRYFLTQQQDGIKKEIIAAARNLSRQAFWGITGKAGTGKTLLLYDIAKTCRRYGRCCVIHSGILCEGHDYLNRYYNEMDVIDAKSVNEDVLKKYEFIFVDESQRLYVSCLELIIQAVNGRKACVVFSYDYFQTLSKAEQKKNIPERLKLIPDFQERELSDKIRSNEEMASFIRILLNLSDLPRKRYAYENIDVLFANDLAEANQIINFYRASKDYVFIEYTKSKYVSHTIDKYRGDMNTHHVVGQEFDNVIIILDKNFRHNIDGRLQGRVHPNPDYIFYKLLYQAVSRAREKLCIVVIENRQLFEKLIQIKYRNFEDGC